MVTTKEQVKNSLFRLLLAAAVIGGLLFGILLTVVMGFAIPDAYKFLKASYYGMAGIFLFVSIYYIRKFMIRYKAFKTLIVLD